MSRLIKIILSSATLFVSILVASWNVLVYLIELIDGGENEQDSHTTNDHTIWYNYRSGDVDPIERTDGLYDDL